MKSQRNPNIRVGILMALVGAFAALAIPTAALAQDPAGDQYAPSTPNGGGDYNFGDPSTGTPKPASAPDSGGGAPPSGASVTPATPADPTAPADAAGGNRDQRTVSQLGAQGRQARDQLAPASGGDVRLASSDASTSAGLGAGLWILIAAALMWAIGIGVVNYRRRQHGHQPA